MLHVAEGTRKRWGKGAPPESSERAQRSGAVRSTVLVVEDDPDLQEIVSDVLSHAGYTPITAGDGQEAIDRLARNPDIALVVLDLMMPVLDGWEFLKKMRAVLEGRDVPVLVLTAFTDARADVLGAAEVIVKPAPIPAILGAVARLLDARKA